MLSELQLLIKLGLPVHILPWVEYIACERCINCMDSLGCKHAHIFEVLVRCGNIGFLEGCLLSHECYSDFVKTS